MVWLGLVSALLAAGLAMAGSFESGQTTAVEAVLRQDGLPLYWLAGHFAAPQAMAWLSLLWLLPGYLLLLWSCVRVCFLLRQAVHPPRIRAAAAGGAEDPWGPPLAYTQAEDPGAGMQAAAAPQAPARAALAEARLAAILQAATDLILVADANHRIVQASRAAARAFGVPAAELPGTAMSKLLAPPTYAHYLAWRSRGRSEAAASGADELAPGHGCRRDGTSFPIEYSLATLPDAVEGRLCALVARDITLLHENADQHRMNHDFQAALVKEAELRQATIARELHDAVASSLAGATLLLGHAQSSTDVAGSAALIGASQQLVIQSMQQIRQIARGIMPAGQDKGALLPALEHFVADVNQLPGIQCTFSSRGDFAEVSGEAGGHLFRIVQEATNNAVRHGKASHIRITLAKAGERHRLTLQDDGQGCDPRILATPLAGMGIRSMQARAEALGGVFGIAARRGRGLRVQVTWEAARAGSAITSANPFLHLRT